MKKLFLLLLISYNTAWASCNELYPDSKPIEPKDTIELCNTFYVVRYDPIAMTPILTSERLDPKKPIGELNRLGTFKADDRIRNSIKPSEYTNSGYDRGHMVPSDDASTKEEMLSTFLTTNSTPQNPKLNQGPWRILEEKVRKLAKSSKEPVYILTISVYGQKPPYFGRLIVPSGYWKVLVKKPAKNELFSNVAWFAPNLPGATVTEHRNVDISKISNTLD